MPRKFVSKRGRRVRKMRRIMKRKSLARKARGLALANYNAAQFHTKATWVADVRATPIVDSLNNYVLFDNCAFGTASGIDKTNQHVLFKKIYDQFRIKAVKMKFYPRFNVSTVGDAAAADAQTQLTQPQYTAEMWTVYDRDSKIPSNLIDIQAHPSARRHRIGRTLTRSFKYRYPNGNWIDTNQDYNTTPPNLFLKEQGLYAHQGFYAQNYPAIMDESLPVVGRVEITYYVVYRGLVLTNIGIDAEKDIVVLSSNEVAQKDPSDVVPYTGVQSVSVSGLVNNSTGLPF